MDKQTDVSKYVRTNKWDVHVMARLLYSRILRTLYVRAAHLK